MTTSIVRSLVGRGRGGWVPRGLAGPTSDQLRALCAENGWAFEQVDLVGVDDKKALMRRLADQLHFPEYFGHNWDAVADCLTDMAPEAPGVILRLKGLGQVPEFLVEPLVEVLDERVSAALGADGLAEGRSLVGQEAAVGVASSESSPLLIVADPPLPPQLNLG